MGRALSQLIVIVRGGGEMASGIAHRLHRCHMRVAITEIAAPTAVRRKVAFAEAVYDGRQTVEGVTAVRVFSRDDAHAAWTRGEIPVFVDPEAALRETLHPAVLIDAVMSKKPGRSRLSDAPLVIGVGPGFTAGVDVHAVVESNRGFHLGRVIWAGAAEPDTGTPAPVAGVAQARLLRAPRSGIFVAFGRIGDLVQAGDIVAEVDGASVQAEIAGQLRGLLRGGIHIAQGSKVGDIDPRGERGYCDLISDKSRAIAGGVVEAVLHRCSDLAF